MRFPIRIDGEELENVKSFCYLGSVITASTSCMEDIAYRIANASSAFNMLQKCLWNTKIKNNTKLRVYRTAIRPILMYGSSTWTLTKTAEGKLDAAERRFLRRIFGYKWSDKIRNTELYAEVRGTMHNAEVSKLSD
ncbi:hypothetical protein AB6A40_004308 [Gnathostoma spinigerum]|uniref:Reverse transcriptase n=1 Tax=Gnathostoma spinigerum TaxID=75299 RepID=A0ABD6EJS6_9BILA